MRAKRLPSLSILCAALIAVPPAPTGAGEPSAQELASLAPVIDSSDGRCRTIDVAGQIGDDKGPGPRLRFHAVYRSQDRSAFLLSDATDGTPLAFGSGRKIIIYDPVGSTVYYSEVGGFSVWLSSIDDKIEFKYNYLLKSSESSKISIDFRSILSNERLDGPFRERVAELGGGNYALTREFNDGPYFRFTINPHERHAYSTAEIGVKDDRALRFDRIVLDGDLDDDLFSFPSKARLSRTLPVKDLTHEDDSAKLANIANLVGRASVVRAVANSADPAAEASKIPGLSGIDWDRVRENDRKYSKALREFVPPSLRSR